MLGLRLKQGTCRKRLNASPSLDRLNPRKGYVPGNVAVISFIANTIKSNATPTQLRKVADWVAKRVSKASHKV